LIYGRAAVTVSDNGVLAYRRTAAEPRRLVWLDRTGGSLHQVGAIDVDASASPEVTPDGRRAAISRVHDGNADVWIVDTDSGVRTRFTSEPSTDMFPIWSPDGRSVIFSANRNGDYDLYERSVVGGAERLLVRSSAPKVPDCVTPDGRLLIYSIQAARNGVDLWAVRLQEPNATPFPLLTTVFDEMAAQVSPDGRWLAYQSNLSGRMEVYIRPFPGEGTEQQVSPEGASQPRWSPNGRELYFISGRDTLMAAALRRGADLQVETLRALFPLRLASGVGIYPAVGTRAQYAVSRDGRFLVNVPVNPAPPASIVVTLNYDRALAR